VGHAVAERYKYRDVTLQVGGWTQGIEHCFVKKNIVGNPKEVKSGWCNRRIWQNLVRKRMWLRTGWFANDDIF
jgi:hypothetical protein